MNIAIVVTSIFAVIFNTYRHFKKKETFPFYIMIVVLMLIFTIRSFSATLPYSKEVVLLCLVNIMFICFAIDSIYKRRLPWSIKVMVYCLIPLLIFSRPDHEYDWLIMINAVFVIVFMMIVFFSKKTRKSYLYVYYGLLISLGVMLIVNIYGFFRFTWMGMSIHTLILWI